MNQFLDFAGGLLYIVFSIFLLPFLALIYGAIAIFAAIKYLKKWRPQVHLPVIRFKKPVFHFHVKHFFSFRH